MKTRFYLLAVILMASITISAQGRNINNEGKRIPSVEQIAKHKADMMRRELRLNDDQYDKVSKLYIKQAKEQAKRMKQLEAERKKMKAKMKGILNDDQYARYEQMGRRPMPHKNMQRGGRDARFNDKARFGRNTPPHGKRGPVVMDGPGAKGNFKPAPEGAFRPAPSRGEPAKGKVEPYGDAKQEKNMYKEIQPK